MYNIYRDILLVGVILLSGIDCDVKTWKFDVDIFNPENWVARVPSGECQGLIFGKENEARIYFNELNLKKLILPKSGTLKFSEGSRITFDARSVDVANCVELKELKFKYWEDFDNWSSRENPDNVAVPHVERLPCEKDDVVFPKGLNTSVAQIMFHGSEKIKSLTIGDDDFDTDRLVDFLESNDGKDSFRISKKMRIENVPCQDSSGCLCSKTKSILCVHEQILDFKCLNPVNPVGFCSVYKMCGGHILMKWKPGFQLSKVKEHLKQYNSDTYASKVVKGGTEYIQVVFAEKAFSGISVDEITEFYNILLNDESFEVRDVKLFTSGPYYEAGSSYRNTMSMIFGTLFGVVIVFATLFALYSPGIRNFNLRNRLMNSRPLSTYVFARYDNLEDRANIYEGQSIVGSVLSLDKPFENPSYGMTPSTSTTSNETIAPKNIQKDEKDNVETLDEYDEIKLDRQTENDDVKVESINTLENESEELLLKDF